MTTSGRLSQNERETEAATESSGLLPVVQQSDLTSLWQEFDAMETPDAHLRELGGPLHAMCCTTTRRRGHAWRKHDVTRGQVLQRVACIEQGMPEMWPYWLDLVDDAVASGLSEAVSGRCIGRCQESPPDYRDGEDDQDIGLRRE